MPRVARETGYEMSDLAEREVERPGIDRRTLIKRTAAVGAVAWAAPTIIGSLASPAGAVTGGFPCSYAIVVVKLANNSVVAVKINTGATACSNDNTTSGDAGFSVACPSGVTYSGGTSSCSGTAICQKIGANPATVVPANSGACPVTVNGGQVTATSGNTILFSIVHDGSCAGHFCPGQCGGNFTAPANCTGV